MINYATELLARHQTQSAAEAKDQGELYWERGDNILQCHYGSSTGGFSLHPHHPEQRRPSSPAHDEETEAQRGPLTSRGTAGKESWASNVTLSGPGQVAQLVRTLSCTPKGCGFDSQSGHIPGLWIRTPAGGYLEAINQWFSHTDVSLPLSLPSSLSKINNHILE